MAGLQEATRRAFDRTSVAVEEEEEVEGEV